MKNQDIKPVFNSLKEQHISFGLPLDIIHPNTEFTIHNLSDVHGDKLTARSFSAPTSSLLFL